MGRYTIRKLFKIEMAHILSTCYSEECKNIHGHSYILEVIITANGLNKDGMVLDFKKLKEIVNKKIIERFDHNLVVQNVKLNFAQGVVFLERSQNKKLVFVDYNPTAEKMTYDMYNSIFWELKREVQEMIYLIVRLHETATGYAEYTGGYLK